MQQRSINDNISVFLNYKIVSFLKFSQVNANTVYSTSTNNKLFSFNKLPQIWPLRVTTIQLYVELILVCIINVHKVCKRWQIWTKCPTAQQWENLIAQMARLRLSRSIKSWSACGVYLFMYFYGFWKNDMTTVGCRHHVMFCRNAICVKGPTSTAGNVRGIKTLKESEDVCVPWNPTSESLLIKHIALQLMRFTASAYLEPRKANTCACWICN